MISQWGQPSACSTLSVLSVWHDMSYWCMSYVWHNMSYVWHDMSFVLCLARYALDKSLQGWTGTGASKHRSIMWLDVAYTFTCNEIDSLNLLSVLFIHFIHTLRKWFPKLGAWMCAKSLFSQTWISSWNHFNLSVILPFTFLKQI